MMEPEMPVEPEEPVIVERCARCQGDIYEDELYGYTGTGFLCTDCLEAEWDRLSVREKFEALGCQPMHNGAEV